MPTEILTPEAGLFGKLPSTGDFVARGLPPAFRRRWDAWVTLHLSNRLKDGTCWPVGGLRFRLVSGGRVAAGAIVQSQDSAGRAFPLSLLLIGADLPAPDTLDQWCDAALAAAELALRGDLDADGLLIALDEVPVPDGAGDKANGLQLWTAQQPATACDPAAPQAAIDLAFAVSCC
jgi:type VI secretion system protein ImpM